MVLTPKAVIAGRLTARPSVPLVIGMIATGLCLALVLLAYLVLIGPGATVIGMLLAVPTGVIALALILFLDRLEPEPVIKLIFAFLWAAGVACLLSLIINTAGMLLYFYPTFGQVTGEQLGAAISAPLVEETLKGAALVLILWRSRDEINGPTDGIIYAGVVGIGFALVENINYYGTAVEEGDAQVVVWTVIMRGLISPLCHPLFTAMTGLGVAYAAHHRGARGVLAVLGGWLGAVLLHFIWNASSTFGLLGLAIAYLILLGEIVAIIVILVRDRRRIVAQIRRYLPLYGPLGIVGPAEVEMLSSLSRRRQARRWAKLRLGPTAARAITDYQLAATELAMLHAHAETRTVDERRFIARQQGLVGLMNLARIAFTAPR